MNEVERNTFGLTARDMQTITTIFQKYPEIRQVVIFGSRAKGTHKLGSDIDLAVVNGNVSDSLLLKTRQNLEESNLPYRVDLVNTQTLAHAGLKAHILRVGKPFYNAAQ